jgi:hypothetical protein
MMETVVISVASSSAVATRSIASPSSSSLSSVRCGASSLSSMALSSPFYGTLMPWEATGMKAASYRRGSQILFAPKTMEVSKLTKTMTTVVSSASYAVPLESARESSFITRPLAEILRDMNKRVPEKVLKVKNDNGASLKYIPW